MLNREDLRNLIKKVKEKTDSPLKVTIPDLRLQWELSKRRLIPDDDDVLVPVQMEVPAPSLTFEIKLEKRSFYRRQLSPSLLVKPIELHI